ncbi:hypothetical protein BU16DRAFT_122340 [Lophium mytilinum]|uniref:Polycomb protein VEFS-Box domain-containing protein n=1 Tax=Lophium mytilinum TaxID=390894 RepID=A0A6A6QHW5_9PEZI|nr:hypothetical protein BU16DRAFT_122340 [Lophium mytilinum]
MVITQTPEFKNFFGNSCLYLTLKESRNRTFLSRNLEAVLDHHQRRLENPTLADTTETRALTRRHWQYPSDGMDDLLQSFENGEILEVSVRGFWPVDPSSKKKASKKIAVGPKAREAIWDALEHAENIIKQPCRVRLAIAIVEPDETKTIPLGDRCKILYSTEHAASISGKQNKGGQRFLKIDVEPFRVDIPTLTVPKSNGVRWKNAIGAKYETTIGISPMDSRKADELLRFLKPNSEFSRYDKAAFSGKWNDLPQLPFNGQMIPVYRKTSEGRMKFEHEIDFEMAFTKSQVSPIALYNQSSKRARPNQLPSPVSETRLLDEMTEVTYRLINGNASKVMTYTDNTCLFCEKMTLPNSERLHHHLKTHHDNYDFGVETQQKERGAATLTEVTILVELSEKREDVRASDSVPDTRAVSWVAPEEPFNLAESNKGNSDWVAKGSYHGKRKAPKPVFRQIKPKEPEEVLQQLPAPIRKRHKVPPAPRGITFFRTLSKRPLEEGESASESDDDIDITWLKLRRNGATSDSDTPESAKTLIKRLDDHMEDEQLTDDLHVGDAIVRFTSQNREWLQESDHAQQLLKKAAELRDDDIITEAVYQHCKKITQMDPVESSKSRLHNRTMGLCSTPPRTPATSSASFSSVDAEPRKRKRSNTKGRGPSQPQDTDGDVEMSEPSPPDSRQLSKDRGQSRTLVNGRCLCGEQAEAVDNLREIIWCDNPVSLISSLIHFHHVTQA